MSLFSVSIGFCYRGIFKHATSYPTHPIPNFYNQGLEPGFMISQVNITISETQYFCTIWTVLQSGFELHLVLFSFRFCSTLSEDPPPSEVTCPELGRTSRCLWWGQQESRWKWWRNENLCAGPASLSNIPLWFDVELNAQSLPFLLKEFLGTQFQYAPRVFYLGISYCPVCCEWEQKQLKEGGVALGSEFKSLPCAELVAAEALDSQDGKSGGTMPVLCLTSSAHGMVSATFTVDLSFPVSLVCIPPLSQTCPEIRLWSDSGSCWTDSQ